MLERKAYYILYLLILKKENINNKIIYKVKYELTSFLFIEKEATKNHRYYYFDKILKSQLIDYIQ